MSDFNMSDFAKELAARRKTEAETLDYNKRIVHAALAAAEIKHVVAHYDGSGDEGQIEEPEWFKERSNVDVKIEGDRSVTAEPWPPGTVNYLNPHSGATEVLPFQKAVHAIFYDGLEKFSPGWEINEGSYGDAYWNVEENTITFEHNMRVASTEYEEYEL